MPQSAYSTINSEWISIGADYFNNFNISISKRACEATTQPESGRARFHWGPFALLATRPVIHLPLYFQHSWMWGETQTLGLSREVTRFSLLCAQKLPPRAGGTTSRYITIWALQSSHTRAHTHTLPSLQTHLMTSSHRLKKSPFYREIKP